MLQRAASNAYSWWWASHVRTKQSKWLDNNLKDMEDRVKCILFLLGEEADSFAKRAEMYYKRRPEVISSVEEAYRAYRALAERYDHMSGELHKANHTIATAFPDQIQYSLLEEDDDNLPKAFTTVDPRKIHKSTVEGLMKKKHGEKSRPKDGGKKSAVPMNKDNAQAEISRLQKEILVLQTEKEFIKSSYESGIAKYWDLEKQINEMQEEVCYFQDEFNESAAIEDDEARALMTATALKSCQDSIIKMQEQQKSFFSQAMIESTRVKVSREKLKGLMGGHGKSLSYSGDSADENVKTDAGARREEFFSMKQEKIELQELVEKIKGYFEMNSDLSMVEIAEKIDELVNKVVDLELMISTQTAQINRLCLENNELEMSLQKLEEEKTTQSDSGEFNDKLKDAEEELIRVHNIEGSYQAEEIIVYTNFTETINSFCDISHMLQSPLIEHPAVSWCILTDEATPSTDTEPSGEHGKTNPIEDPEIDEAARKPHVDVFLDHPDALEPSIFSDDSKSSSGYHEIRAEKHFYVDNFSAAASVDVGTTESADQALSDDNNNGGSEHVFEIASESNVQPYIVHSHESDSLEGLHHISSNSQEENLKQEDNMIYNSKPCNSIFEDSSEQKKEMNKEEDSYSIKIPASTNEKVADAGDQEDNMINLQQLLMNGLQDKEKVLLAEYTSILRNYKNAKRRLTEVETMNQEYLNEMRAMISELECANGMKDAEIRSLRELLKSLTYKDASQSGRRLNSTMSISENNGMIRGHRRTPSFLPVHQGAKSVSSIPSRIKNRSSLKNNPSIDFANPKEPDASHDAVTNQESVILEELTSTNVAEMDKTSPLEEKFRRDIDVLLEENLAFLMKFSMSFQQIQRFQTKYDQLESEIGLKPKKDHTNDQPAKSEMEATEKSLRELKIELQVWLEQNAMFKEELQFKFDSLCNIQAEIEGAMDMDADTEDGAKFTSYQVAKFQGEILNMKQENNKVADELQAGLDHVKGLQTEIENVLAKILKSTSLYGPKSSSTWRNVPSKSRVPLRMFLFPAKKKKSSLFACVNPALLSKQNSDMAFFTKMG
ncbi:Kinase-interacting protein 1 [Dichanthelium oligosanthes]|uniref:Kinase-interacting protein 1 n=1 Tax=Dichanthelium oligosanthes TaxID=888268 RepID=A0A1E5VDW0_9POAL|nr:Kinase-interacting protein 1 [Dichanthelium oligosanthes]